MMVSVKMKQMLFADNWGKFFIYRVRLLLAIIFYSLFLQF